MSTCTRCGGDGKIRCPDSDCLVCMADNYCSESTPCPGCKSLCAVQGNGVIDMTKDAECVVCEENVQARRPRPTHPLGPLHTCPWGSRAAYFDCPGCQERWEIRERRCSRRFTLVRTKMTLRKRKLEPLEEPTLALTRAEVRVLRACYMGDHLDGPALNAVSKKIEVFLQKAPDESA